MLSRNIFGLAVVAVLLTSCCHNCKKGSIETQTVTTVAPGSAEDFDRNIANTVYFGFDKQNLTAEAVDVLSKVKDWLSTYPTRNVVIEGHTDVRGTAEYNLALGSRRAEAVKGYLVSNGIAEDRLKTISFGKEAPVTEGTTEQDHALNRRAHMVITQ